MPRLFIFLLSLTFLPQALALSPAITPEKAPTSTTQQNSPAPMAVNTAATGNTLVIPARTPVFFTLDTMVSSKTAKPGDFFQVKVAEDLKINDQVLVPAGTPATGEVIHAQKAGGGGKAGELLVTIRYIELNGQKIKMRSFLPIQGKSNSDTAITTSAVLAATIPVISPLALFIRGGQIEIPANTYVQALVAADSIVAPVSVPVIQNNEQLNQPAIQTTGDSQ